MRQFLHPLYGLVIIPDKIETEDYVIGVSNGLILVDRTILATYKLYQTSEVLHWDTAVAAVGDLVFDLWSGPILSDRGTGIMYRLYLDNEEPKWEVVTQSRTRDIVWMSNVGFVLTDTAAPNTKYRRYIENEVTKREVVI